MSTMLEQAFVDASALKEAALKNAETAILERYATEVKNTMDTILEVEEELGLSPMPEPSAEDQIPYGATEGESACPCPDEKEVTTLSFSLDDLKQAYDALGPEPEDLEASEDLAVQFGAEEEEEEDFPLELQEEVEIDEELLFEYPEEGGKEVSEELTEQEDDILPEGIDLDKLVEEVIVDLAGDELTGWAGRPGPDVEYAKQIRLARLAGTEAKEQKEQLEAAIEELAESNNNLVGQNKNLKQLLVKMKGKLEEVNLSNAKLLYMNRTLNSPSLNERQKSKIVESIQNTGSVEEAKVIYETLQSTVGSSKKEPKSLSEAIRKPSLSMPRKRKQTPEKQTILKERFQRLAGISKTTDN
jgi:hypothetical protein